MAIKFNAPASMQEKRRVALGAEIATRRKARDWTQYDLALKLNWSRTTIVAMEAGRQAVTVDQLYALADALKTFIGEFLLSEFRDLASAERQALDPQPATPRPTTSSPRARSSSSSSTRARTSSTSARKNGRR